jgi:uncharacterized membrane protein
MAEFSIDDLLKTEDKELHKLHLLVHQAMRDEKLIMEKLKNPDIDILTRGQRVADVVARFGGSWGFIISFFAILLLWILLNVLMFSKAFDPYPFILLNLILSCLAAIQAPIIMMSQNRQEEKDRIRAENDYVINLKAEIEIRNLHEKLHILMEGQFKNLMDSQAGQFEMMQKINARLERMENPNRSSDPAASNS